MQELIVITAPNAVVETPSPETAAPWNVIVRFAACPSMAAVMLPAKIGGNLTPSEPFAGTVPLMFIVTGAVTIEGSSHTYVMSTVPIMMSFHGDTIAEPFFGLLLSVAVQSVTVNTQTPGRAGSAAPVIGVVVVLATSRTTSPVFPSSTVPFEQPGATTATQSAATAIRLPYLARIVMPPLAELHDLRRDEDQELPVLVRDVPRLEQPSQHGNLAEPRHPGLARRLVHREDTADDRRAAIGDQHLRRRPLRVDRRRATHGVHEVRGVVLDLDVEDDRPLRGDLRRDGQAQRGRHELDVDLRRGRVDDGDPDALLDLGPLVVLGRDLRRRQDAPASLRLEGVQGDVERERV